MREKKKATKPVKAVKAVKKPVPVKTKKAAPAKDYDKDFEYVCKEIERGIALRKACPAFMSMEKFYQLLEESEDRAKRYARACEARADAIFEDLIDISDDSSADKYMDDDGIERTNNEAIQRSRLRVDARKWMLSKMAPKKYGDKIEVDANVNANVTTTVISLGSGVDPDASTT